MPTFTGIISHEELTFEGIARPHAIFTIGENAAKSPEDMAILERYFADIQNLFQKKFLAFSSDGDTSGFGQDSARLRSLLDELIKVKTLISTDSMSSGSVGGKNFEDSR